MQKKLAKSTRFLVVSAVRRQGFRRAGVELTRKAQVLEVEAIGAERAQQILDEDGGALSVSQSSSKTSKQALEEVEDRAQARAEKIAKARNAARRQGDKSERNAQKGKSPDGSEQRSSGNGPAVTPGT